MVKVDWLEKMGFCKRTNNALVASLVYKVVESTSNKHATIDFSIAFWTVPLTCSEKQKKLKQIFSM